MIEYESSFKLGSASIDKLLNTQKPEERDPTRGYMYNAPPMTTTTAPGPTSTEDINANDTRTLTLTSNPKNEANIDEDPPASPSTTESPAEEEQHSCQPR